MTTKELEALKNEFAQRLAERITAELEKQTTKRRRPPTPGPFGATIDKLLAAGRQVKR